MKYTIEGFSQRNALAMKLSLEDLLFLRWFIDFKEDGEMIWGTGLVINM